MHLPEGMGFELVSTGCQGNLLSQLQPKLKQLLPLQERQSEDDDADVIVKIFVEFKTTSYAKAARDALVS